MQEHKEHLLRVVNVIVFSSIWDEGYQFTVSEREPVKMQSYYLPIKSHCLLPIILRNSEKKFRNAALMLYL